MSRGLGWLQQRVLAYLDDQGGWGWAFEVALNLAEQQADQNQPSSRALEVSVRRAVHTLARRGVVRVGYYPLGEAWDAHRPLSLLLWRPEAESHVQALLAPRRRWVDDDATVLRVLRAIGQEDVDAWWTSARGVRGYGSSGARRWALPHTQPPWVPYQLAAARVADALGARDQDGRVTAGGATAIRRAFTRLAKRGRVVLAHASPSRVRAIAAVRWLPTTGEPA